MAACLLVLLLMITAGCGPEGPGQGDPDAALDGGLNPDAGHPDAALDGSLDPDGQACVDECPQAGQPGCLDDGLVECGQHDADPCLEWSAPVACDEGLRCDPATFTCREPCGDFCDPFSIVLLPDTQYYTSKQANNASNTYRKQTQWIADHQASDAIQFVVHLGDITNNNTSAQWQIASDAHAILDAAAVPYTVVTGNHDYLVSGGWDRGSSLIGDYFPVSRFSGNPWYGGAYGSNMANNYAYFSVGPMQFLVLSLEYSPRKDVLCWADDLITAHPDHHVILATHCYLTHGGGYSGGCPDVDYASLGAAGVDVWEELVSRHANVFLVVSGHVGDSEYRTRTSNTGHTVHEMLVDYQFEAECREASASQCTNHCYTGTYQGNGWMRKLVFDPRANTIEAVTFTVEDGNPDRFPQGQPAFFCSELFSPSDPAAKGDDWYAADPASTQHQFTFTQNVVDPPATGYELLGDRAFNDRTINRVSTGDQLVPVTAMAPDGSFVVVWQDDASDTDGAGNHDILVRGFAPGGCVAFPDYRVNVDDAGHQQTPAVAMDAAGRFVVAWADDTDDNGVFQIKARGFDAAGQERFAPITVNTVATGQQLAPTVALAPDGRFVVAWQDDPESDDTYQVWFRGFHADGTERFADRSAHDDVAGTRIKPAVGLDADARIVVAWQDDGDGNGAYQIHARGFDADGTDRFARITVNSVADGQQLDPALAVAGNGRFLVIWRDDADGDGSYRVLGRGFLDSGAGWLADFALSTAGGQRLQPALAASPAGIFAAAWAEDADGDGSYEIVARSYQADGSVLLDRVTANRVVAGDQRHPGLAVDDAGDLVVVWQDDMDANGTWQIVGKGL
jgi:hypothetical protein